MFPIVINDGKMELPKEGTYYLVAGDGIWLHKDHAAHTATHKVRIASAFVKVEGIGFLKDVKDTGKVQYHLPKVPQREITRIKYFFEEVVNQFCSEACCILYYNIVSEEWKVLVTPQNVSHGGVRYELKETLQDSELKANPRWILVGTIHSHCDFNAFHSGTDVADEEDFDGLHATFGHNDQDEFSITACIVVNARREKIDPLEVLEGIEYVKGKDFYILTDEITPEDEVEVGEWLENVDGRGRTLIDRTLSKVDSLRQRVVETVAYNTQRNQLEAFSEQLRKQEGKICVGDLVVWHKKNDLSRGGNHYWGEGPFEVEEIRKSTTDFPALFVKDTNVGGNRFEISSEWVVLKEV